MAYKRPKHRRPKQDDGYKPSFSDELLNLPIETFKLREETLALLIGAGVLVAKDLVMRTEKDFYRITKFNKKNLFDVKNALKSKNMFIKPLPEPVITEGGSAQTNGGANASNPNGNNPNRSNLNNSNPNGSNLNGGTASRGKQDKRRQGQESPKDGNRNESVDGRQKNTKNGQNFNNVRIERRYDLTPKEFTDNVVPERPPRVKVIPAKDDPDIYVKVSRGGKWGFKDRQGKQCVEPLYDEVFNYKENLCCVEKDGLCGYINRQGEVVVPIVYEVATSFSEGYACVYLRDHCGFITANNEVVVPLQFDAATAVIDGECRVKKDGKWGELHLTKNEETGEIMVGDIRWIT